ALVLLSAPVASAQQRDSIPRDRGQRTTTLDSLAAQLARTDSALALLRQQVATESVTAVRMRSRIQLDLSARLVLNSSLTTGAVSAAELPIFAAPSRANANTLAMAPSVFGISMRQALLGGSVSMDSVAGATLLADFELDFFARALEAAPPLFPEPRLRTARVFLLWPRTEVMFGMETPLISDLNPISTAGVAIPVFAGAGNLWNWLPQLRLTQTLATRGQWSAAVQGAVISPNASERAVSATPATDIGQASARPAVESRLRLRHGVALDDQPAQGVLTSGFEVGIGTHRGWLRPSRDGLLTSWALTADMRASLGHGVEIRGEAYRGSLLRGLGGGGIGQNFGTLGLAPTDVGAPLTDVAGWLQVNAQWHPMLSHGVGCGTARVVGNRADRRRNTVCTGHATWRPAVPLFVSLEYRGLRTRYSDGPWSARHWNLAIGIDL
ncbi:MAG: hypothetical protein ACK54K_13480, partial [Gemmatimonadaceae bacterium]